MWLWTGSKTTKRGAEPRVARYRAMRQQADRKKAQREKLGNHENRLSPIFPLASVLSAGGESRLCASLRPLRGAKNAALTNLPLRSCVASSHRKNVRNKWERGSDPGRRHRSYCHSHGADRVGVFQLGSELNASA